MEPEKNNVCVVVLGDIGRSPRMQYHALSLGQHGHTVDIIGYGETEPLDDIKKAPSIYYHYMCPVPHIPIGLLNYAFKTIFQAINLLFLLVTIRQPKVLMVQNPPAIPSLIICWLFCWIVGAKLIIDWHNYANSLMALKLGPKHVLVQITKWCEGFFGSKADYNFCVTNGMKNDLLSQWGIIATTLYDKPAEMFRPINLEKKHKFLLEIGKKYKEFLCEDDSTVFTKETNGKIVLKDDRPGFIVSSTSWTEDEDFSMLINVLQDYEEHINSGNTRQLPQLICVVTGKGDLKSYYCKQIDELNWKNIKFITPWLEPADYPLMLASADVGISLHTSSSGLDLPMKVVDMFGCCLPVIAHSFKCSNELIKCGENGYSFSTSEELSAHVFEWFEKHNPQQLTMKSKFKLALTALQEIRWTDNWDKIAYNAFN